MSGLGFDSDGGREASKRGLETKGAGGGETKKADALSHFWVDMGIERLPGKGGLLHVQ